MHSYKHPQIPSYLQGVSWPFKTPSTTGNPFLAGHLFGISVNDLCDRDRDVFEVRRVNRHIIFMTRKRSFGKQSDSWTTAGGGQRLLALWGGARIPV